MKRGEFGNVKFIILPQRTQGTQRKNKSPSVFSVRSVANLKLANE